MIDLAKLAKMREFAEILERYGLLKGKRLGGGRGRTYDAADMIPDDWDESY
jgi:hypothetical protein